MQGKLEWAGGPLIPATTPCPIHRAFVVQYQDILYTSLSGHPLQVVFDLGGFGWLGSRCVCGMRGWSL